MVLYFPISIGAGLGIKWVLAYMCLVQKLILSYTVLVCLAVKIWCVAEYCLIYGVSAVYCEQYYLIGVRLEQNCKSEIFFGLGGYKELDIA
jgi:hypothetical protein